MGILTPDKIRYENGVRICEKIIPQNTKWTNDSQARKVGARAGEWYISQYKIKKMNYVTIHNTEAIKAITPDDAEQYVRATWPNQNMGDVRVHYYVDEQGAWQMLAEDVVGWHSQTGNDGPGNSDSIAIEIIENDGKTVNTNWNDPKSEDNGARLAASILHRYGLGIDRLATHYKWSPTKKYCPEVLLPKWDSFVAVVKKYLDALNGGSAEVEDKPATENKVNWEARYKKLREGLANLMNT
jgi:N-acetylmuramoyl-L-alanine amidase CwlA